MISAIVQEYGLEFSMEGKYGVAYLDKEGKGFSKTEPYIVDCGTERICRGYVKDMLEDGYNKVIPFMYNERKDYYDWDYVKRNKF